VNLRGKDKKQAIMELKRKMVEAAKDLEFEKAAVYRDKIMELEQAGMEMQSAEIPYPAKKRAPKTRQRKK
jgi:excinuclease UvrABC helicase subunit UvrB